MQLIPFSKHKIDAYWRQYPAFKALFSSMREVEEWILEDNVDVYASIESWVKSLDSETLANLNDKAQPLIIVLFFLSTQKAMYLYKQLTEANETLDRALQFTANAMLQKPETNIIATVFWDRFRSMMFEQSIEDFLSPERLTRIKQAIDYVMETKGGVFQ